MSVYWNSRTKGLNPYVPGEQPPQNKKIIKLNTNENPYPPAPAVMRLIRKAVDPTIRLYPDPESVELRNIIAEKYAVEPDEVFVGNGSDEVLAFAFAAFFEQSSGGEEDETLPILFPDITYSFYPVYAELFGIPYETPPLNDDFCIDPKDYRKACGGVVFASPNAPTGISVELPALRSVINYQGKKNKVVILDQAYAIFTGKSTKVTTSLVHRYPNLLTVHTLSKANSLAGLRVGFAIGNKELIQGLVRIRDSFNSYTMDRLAQVGATAAISATRYYKTVAKRIIATRERIAGELSKLKIQVIPSEANFLFIRIPGMEGAKVSAALKRKGILVRHFDKPRIKDYIRVSIGTDEDMDFVLEQFKDILSKKKAAK